MARWISLSSLILLCGVFAFSWGWLAQGGGLFPGAYLKEVIGEVTAFAKGGEGDQQRSLTERLEADFLHPVGRHLLSPWQDTSQTYWPTVEDRVEALAFEGWNQGRAAPVIYKPQALLFEGGHLLLFGALDSDRSLFGVMILDHKGHLLRSIPLEEAPARRAVEAFNAARGEGQAAYRFYEVSERFPHGIEALRDGSIIFNDGDRSNTLRRVGWCGEEIWTRVMRSHHVVQLFGDKVWVLEENKNDPSPIEDMMSLIDVKSGRTIKQISIAEIVAANRDRGALEIRHLLYRDKWLDDPYHANDVEPLPLDMAVAFPQFEAGDLLLSFRSLDLIMVIDPESLKMKWWRAGATRRQHDPDWQSNGKITVFDNLMNPAGQPGVSRILEIDPVTMESRVLYDGAVHDFYTAIRGKHQILPDGSLLLTSAQQGRVLRVDRDGQVIFDLINYVDHENALPLAKALYLPPGYLSEEVLAGDCSN